MATIILFVGLLAILASVEDPKPVVVKLAGIKCVVSGKQTTQKYHADHKRGKVYFDCNASRIAFQADKRQFGTKANHQLVVTKQYIQTKCPISKNRISTEDSFTASVAGVSIRFCCQECKTSFLEQYKSPAQIEALFAQSNFHSFFAPRPKVTKRSTDKSVR